MLIKLEDQLLNWILIRNIQSINYCAHIVFNVRQSYFARYSYRLDVCPSVRSSVCPSVTRWYCVKTAQPIVKLSSLPDSPYDSSFMRTKLFPGIPMETPPTGALNARG